MNTRLCSFIVALMLAVFQFGTHSLNAETRTFTSTAGTSIQGELVSVNGDMVTIKKADGQSLTIKAANFSAADVAYLQAHGLKTAAATPIPAGAAGSVPFTNTLGMKFVPVPGTDILMCIHITRRGDYAAYAAAKGSVDSSWKSRPKDNNGTPINQDDDYPVVGVSWNDAQEFCAWLSQKENHVYRLPTDLEWSFAVGIGPREKDQKNATPESLSGKIKDVFPWGTQWPPPKGTGNFDDASHAAIFPKSGKGIAGYTDGFPMTSPVTAFKPNKLGIHDLSGNITQWCADWFDKDHTQRVRRGIDYQSGDKRSGYFASQRWGSRPSDRLYMDIGFASFRCVVVASSL